MNLNSSHPRLLSSYTHLKRGGIKQITQKTWKTTICGGLLSRVIPRVPPCVYSHGIILARPHVTPSSLFEQPSRHSETTYFNHLCHWAGHTSLIAPNPLECVRIWSFDTGMTDGTFLILNSMSMDYHVQFHIFNKLRRRQVVSWCVVWHNPQLPCSCDDCPITIMWSSLQGPAHRYCAFLL